MIAEILLMDRLQVIQVSDVDSLAKQLLVSMSANSQY